MKDAFAAPRAERRATRPSRDRRRDSLTFGPLLWTVVALVTGLLLGRVYLDQGSVLARLCWPAGRDDAVQLLGVLAGAVLTAVSFVVSSLVIALQLASTQFSPRLLRAFVRDDTVKRVLAILLATFVYSVAVLREVRPGAAAPQPAMLLACVLAILTVVAIVRFLGHIVGALRIDTMMAEVHREAVGSLRAEFADAADPGTPHDLPQPPEDALALRMPDDGFIDTVDLAPLADWARERDLQVRLDVGAGMHAVEGVPIGWAWRRGGAGTPDAHEAAGVVARAVRVGFERTPHQDTAYGFRRLVDIGVKAMSPAVNDPTTAAHAVGHLASMLVDLAGRPLGPALVRDRDGVLRVMLARHDLRFFMALSCGQLRRYGAREPAVVTALLVMLRDLAVVARRDADRAAIVHEADLVLQAAQRELQAEADLDVVRRRRAAVDAALAGDLQAAYQDRTDEALSR